MKKAISLLLGVLLVCSLSGFTYESDPYRAYVNAANRAYKENAFERTFVNSALIESPDGRVGNWYQHDKSRSIGSRGNMQMIAKAETVMDGEFIKRDYYYKDHWRYEKIDGKGVFLDTNENTIRNEIPDDQFDKNFWFLLYDYVGKEQLEKATFTYDSGQRLISFRLPRAVATERLVERDGEEGVRADLIEGRIFLDAQGRIAKEHVNFIYRYPEEDGWERWTMQVRSYFTWPADTTPIVFPDDLDTYAIALTE